MTEQENRQYAASLLNRANQPFDARDLAMVAKVVELVERDVAAWVEIQLKGPAIGDNVIAGILRGTTRPKTEGN